MNGKTCGRAIASNFEISAVFLGGGGWEWEGVSRNTIVTAVEFLLALRTATAPHTQLCAPHSRMFVAYNRGTVPNIVPLPKSVPRDIGAGD